MIAILGLDRGAVTFMVTELALAVACRPSGWPASRHKAFAAASDGGILAGPMGGPLFSGPTTASDKAHCAYHRSPSFGCSFLAAGLGAQ